MDQTTRRQFVAATIKAAAVMSVLPLVAQSKQTELAIVRNGSPAELVRKAIELLGGISRFVQKGQSVLIKPNVSWDRLPEQAATTNPEAVAEVVALCRQAGAQHIRIVDRTCNKAQRCYQRSGIESLATAAGAQVRHIVDSRFIETEIPNGHLLKLWPIYKDVFDFDVLINMPIAKHHNVSGVTLGMKNVMGLIGGNRGDLHVDFDKKIVDLNTIIRPTLTIVDAYRVLLNNGPSGGSLDDVAERKIVIAGTDPVATDAQAAKLLDVDPQKLVYLTEAQTRGLGKMDGADIILKEYSFL